VPALAKPSPSAKKQGSLPQAVGKGNAQPEGWHAKIERTAKRYVEKHVHGSRSTASTTERVMRLAMKAPVCMTLEIYKA
jgi:hypothetical protein